MPGNWFQAFFAATQLNVCASNEGRQRLTTERQDVAFTAFANLQRPIRIHQQRATDGDWSNSSYIFGLR